MTKNTFVAIGVALALVACGGGSAESSGGSTARQGSHPDQGTAAPHIECGTSAGHHGGGCPDSTSGGATTTDGSGTTPDGSGTTTTATDADAGAPAPQ